MVQVPGNQIGSYLNSNICHYGVTKNLRCLLRNYTLITKGLRNISEARLGYYDTDNINKILHNT